MRLIDFGLIEHVAKSIWRSRLALEKHSLKHRASKGIQKVRRMRSGPRASQACHACATAKAKCDNGSVCKRCIRKSLSCVRTQQPTMDDLDPSLAHDVAAQPTIQLPAATPCMFQDTFESCLRVDGSMEANPAVHIDHVDAPALLPCKSPVLMISRESLNHWTPSHS